MWRRSVCDGSRKPSVYGRIANTYINSFAEIEYPAGSKDAKGRLKEDAEPIGVTITCKTWKNSLCSPGRRLELQIRFAGKLSMNREGEIAVFGKKFGVFRAKNGNEITGGASWCYEGRVLGENQKTVEDVLRDDPELAIEITQKIRELMS